MIEYLERQEMTGNQWRIIATANLGDMLDFFDFFLIGYVLAFIFKEWHLTYGQSALILISAGLGAVPGAFFWGWMGGPHRTAQGIHPHSSQRRHRHWRHVFHP
jgi:MFS transporter, putative metabolite:H+ symporter